MAVDKLPNFTCYPSPDNDLPGPMHFGEWVQTDYCQKFVPFSVISPLSVAEIDAHYYHYYHSDCCMYRHDPLREQYE